MPPTVGWIGCGVMGKSMVKNLLRGGYSVGLYSRTRSAAQSLIDLGAGWFSSPMALAMEHERGRLFYGDISRLHSFTFPFSG
jgi:3-hydroxyisobutyrate dehydrogenase-like beta-hydroxyacid dehydrogenase